MKSKPGLAGFSQGQNDANTTCLTILANINSKELTLPGKETVYVYLDVEAGTNLTVDYWAGWADYVWHYNVNGSEPLFPAMYAHFTEINGVYSLDQHLQDVLNAAHTAYPGNEVCCFGFWASEPEPCSYCDPTAAIVVPQYATYTQPCIGSGRTVPMMIRQYAERGSLPVPPNDPGSGCLVSLCARSASIFGGQIVDLERSFSSLDTSSMLVIK